METGCTFDVGAVYLEVLKPWWRKPLVMKIVVYG